jgi:hypothetical protein
MMLVAACGGDRTSEKARRVRRAGPPPQAEDFYEVAGAGGGLRFISKLAAGGE